MKNQLRICLYCLQAMKSHGEKVKVLSWIDEDENNNTCQYCDELGDELVVIEF